MACSYSFLASFRQTLGRVRQAVWRLAPKFPDRKTATFCLNKESFNKGIRDWLELFVDDEILGTATLDPLLHQPHVHNVKGRRYCSPKPGDDLKL